MVGAARIGLRLLAIAALLFVTGKAPAQVCTTDLQCTLPAAPICNPPSCAPCATSVECLAKNPLTPVCSAGQCVACVSNASCSAPTPICDLGTGACVACLAASDCSGSTPVCNVGNDQCVACQNDFGGIVLACSDPQKPACHTGDAGALSGACTQCSTTNQALCTGNRPLCETATGACGCAANIDCGAKTGKLCDSTQPPAGQCVPGCKVTLGTDNCPTGQFCNKRDGTTGTCVAEPCLTSADCTSAPNLQCDTSGEPHECVQCTKDGDCKAGTVCDTVSPAHLKTCVACTPGKTQNCVGNAAGPTCLGDDQCGCVTDSDCGGAGSGKVCNGQTHACEPGCRGTNGNGCPSGQSCTSGSDDIGHCTSGASDGGADGGAGDGGPLDASGGDTPVGANDGGPGNGGDLDGSPNDASPVGNIEGGGCSCTLLGGAGASSGAAALGVLLALSLWAARRKSR